MVGDLAILFLSPTFADCNQIYVLLADDQLHERQSSLPVWPAALITSLTPPVNLTCRRNLSKESNPIQQITLSQKSGLWISARTCGIKLKAVVLLQLHKQLIPNPTIPVLRDNVLTYFVAEEEATQSRALLWRTLVDLLPALDGAQIRQQSLHNMATLSHSEANRVAGNYNWLSPGKFRKWMSWAKSSLYHITQGCFFNCPFPPARKKKSALTAPPPPPPKCFK